MTDETPLESPEETAAFFETVTSNPMPSGYTPMDRYADFRAVFLGDERGRRVLRQLLARGHMFKPSFPGAGPIDPVRMGVHEGERNMALWLVDVINTEPQTRPTRAVSKPKDVA